jgi:hypothetical protein
MTDIETRLRAELERADQAIAMCDQIDRRGGHRLLPLARELAEGHRQMVQEMLGAHQTGDIAGAAATMNRRHARMLAMLAHYGVCDDGEPRP